MRTYAYFFEATRCGVWTSTVCCPGRASARRLDTDADEFQLQPVCATRLLPVARFTPNERGAGAAAFRSQAKIDRLATPFLGVLAEALLEVLHPVVEHLWFQSGVSVVVNTDQIEVRKKGQLASPQSAQAEEAERLILQLGDARRGRGPGRACLSPGEPGRRSPLPTTCLGLERDHRA